MDALAVEPDRHDLPSNLELPDWGFTVRRARGRSLSWELIVGEPEPPESTQLLVVEVDAVFTCSEYVTVIVDAFVSTIDEIVGTMLSVASAAAAAASRLVLDDVSVTSWEPACVYSNCNCPPAYPEIEMV